MPGIITDPLNPPGVPRQFQFTTPGPVKHVPDAPGDPEWEAHDKAQMVAAVLTLAGFFRYMWRELVPGPEMLWGPHMDIVCFGLEQTVFGNIENNELCINIPPRSLKSTMVAQALPAWLWLHRPSTQILTLSVNDRIITQNNRAIRRCVESDRYKRLVAFARDFLKAHVDIPEWRLADDQNEKRRFENTAGGICQGLPAGADIIGIGYHLLVVDDPIDVSDTKDLPPESIAAAMWKIIDDYGEKWGSRANDPKRACRITIMQRLHVLDLAGFLLDGVEEVGGKRRGGGVENIVLPTEYDPDHPHVCALDWRTERGELLFPDRLGAAEVAQIKRVWEPSAYAAQHDQRPVPKGGGQFPHDAWTFYDVHPREIWRRAKNAGGFVFSSTDCANKVGLRNAYTVIYVLAYFPPDEIHPDGAVYVLDRYRGQVEYPGLEAEYLRTRQSWETQEDVVEDAQNGTTLLQRWLPVAGHHLVSVSPHMYGGKQTRANHTQRRLGRVGKDGLRRDASLFLPNPEKFSWVQEVINEHTYFPQGNLADQVDALSQAVLYVDVIRNADAGAPADMAWVGGLAKHLNNPIVKGLRGFGIRV